MSVPQRHMVRMAEQVVSQVPGDVLVTLGLGSCIGLALVDAERGIAGLSHIVLPEAPPAATGTVAAKFADTAVPALLDAVIRAGASRARLKAVICGGASMFGRSDGAGGSIMQIGERNRVGTVAALKLLNIPLRAHDTGGSSGRSVEVRVESGEVHVRGVGQAPRKL